VKQVGVEAVVKKLNGFLSDIKKMTGAAENLSEGLLDIGASLSGMGIEAFSDDILNVAGAATAAAPEIGLLLTVLKGFGDKIEQNREELKAFAVKTIKIALAALRTLKDMIVRVINIALKPFRAAWKAITGTIRRVAEIASGILIAGTIRKLGEVIREAGQSALEAGINFQVMMVRLEGLAARQALNSGAAENFSEALGMAGVKSKELLDWVVDLSLTAPISTNAIADTLTLATSYGLAEDAAKDMTTAVLNFASGMGLTDVAQRRIIENFGQMIQQGKITSMELRDMGRGAFVPVNDLLNRTAELLGMTADDFDGTAGSINEFAGENGLDAVKASMQAFIDLSNQEFQGAIERMGNTISGLRTRFKNLINSIVGLNILQAPLELIGEKIGEIFTALGEDEGLQEITMGIGETLKGMVEDLLGDLPSVETIVETIKGAIQTISDALVQIREGDLRGALETLGVPEGFMNFIDRIKEIIESEDFQTFVDNITIGFSNIKTFWENNKEPIIEALLIAVGEIADALGIELPENPGETFRKWTEELDATTIINKINDVKDAVIKFIEKVEELPAKIEKLIPWIWALGAAYLFLKRPLLAIGLGLVAGVAALVKTGQGGDPTGMSAESTVAQTRTQGYLGGNQQTINNYNMNMSAYYQDVQSPAAIKDDVSVLLSSIGH